MATTTARTNDFGRAKTQGVLDAYRAAGYGHTLSDGSFVPDPVLMKKAAFEAIRERKVASKRQRSDKALTKGELYSIVFPDAPPADDKLDELDAAIRGELMRLVWDLTQQGPKGYLQKMIGVSDPDWVLCKGTIVRGKDTTQGVYLTTDHDLIFDESMLPEIEKLVRKANSLRAHAEMVLARQPALRGRVTTALESGVKRVEAAGQLGSGKP